MSVYKGRTHKIMSQQSCIGHGWYWNEKLNLEKTKRQKANEFWNQQTWRVSIYFSIISIKMQNIIS